MHTPCKVDDFSSPLSNIIEREKELQKLNKMLQARTTQTIKKAERAMEESKKCLDIQMKAVPDVETEEKKEQKVEQKYPKENIELKCLQAKNKSLEMQIHSLFQKINQEESDKTHAELFIKQLQTDIIAMKKEHQMHINELNQSHKRTFISIQDNELNLRKEIKELKKELKQLQLTKNTQEITISKLSSELNDEKNKRASFEKNFTEKELISTIKKQMYIIDMLKRQNMHMMAEKNLAVKEKEFEMEISKY